MISSNAIRLLSAISLSWTLCRPLAAQEHFEALCDTTPWLVSRNVAGLTALPDDVRSNYAETYFQKDNGGWGDYYASPGSYEFGARTASFYRVNSRLVLSGNVSYSSFQGKDMTGSVWLDPDDQPFDIVEMDPQFAGTKNREMYNLMGGLGLDLGQGFSLGARVDFTSANNAKRRDLRSQNKLMDLEAGGGVLWAKGIVQLGLSYNYRRTIEELLFKTYGTTGIFYASLIDYGALFGVSEYSNANGLTDEDEERPMLSERHSVSLQLGMGKGSTKMLHEGWLEWREGYYGKRSLFTPVFMEHSGTAWGVEGKITWLQRHAMTYRVTGSHLENWQNLYTYVNQGGGLNEYIYHGRLKTRGQRTLSAETGYRFYGNAWVHQVKAGYHERRLTASLYPFYRRQNIHYTDVNLASRRLWYSGKHDWSAELQLGYQKGGGIMAEDGNYDGAGEGTSGDAGLTLIRTSLVTLPAALQQHYDYLTASQGNVGLNLLYGRRLYADRIRIFALLSVRYQRAWSVTADVENHHQTISLSLGCTF